MAGWICSHKPHNHPRLYPLKNYWLLKAVRNIWWMCQLLHPAITACALQNNSYPESHRLRMVKPNSGHRLDQEELQWDAHNPVHLWIYTSPCKCFWCLWTRFALSSLMMGFHLLLLEETQSVFGAEVLKEEGWSCSGPLFAEPGLLSCCHSKSPRVG